jgi:DNA-binding beta-propeller fold protein YncE
MKKIYCACVALVLATGAAAVAIPPQEARTSTTRQEGAHRSTVQKASAGSAEPLVLSFAIPLEGVKGRFDHFAFGAGRLFVSELGNNSVAIINLSGRTLEHTITGVPDPQGEAYSPETGKLFVGSGTSEMVFIYKVPTYQLIGAVHFPGGADNLRYDAANKRVYVGCGNDEQSGGIGTIDATTNQRTDEDYKLGGEPESFQLEKSGPNIYVNLPSLNQIAVINRITQKVTRWAVSGHNTPMALDEADHRLFVGTSRPPRLVVLDTNSGHIVALLPSVGADDLYYDSSLKRIYMPGAQGVLNVFEMTDPDHYHLLAQVPTALGAATAGYPGVIGKSFNRIYLAVPQTRANKSAEIRMYESIPVEP